jgi:hypothetical protein
MTYVMSQAPDSSKHQSWNCAQIVYYVISSFRLPRKASLGHNLLTLQELMTLLRPKRRAASCIFDNRQQGLLQLRQSHVQGSRTAATAVQLH